MHQTHAAARDYVDLGDLLSIIWRYRIVVALLTVALTAVAAVVAVRLPDVYRSEVKLKPAEDTSGGMQGMSGLAAIGSLAGVKIGGDVTKADLAIAVLKSRRFLTEFAKRHAIVVPLMAGKEWDQASGKLLLDPEVYNEQRGWLRPARPPLGSAPSDEEIYRKLFDILEVEEDPTNGIVTVSVTFVSPVHAQQWASLLVRDLNAEMRQRQLGEFERALLYLEQHMRSNTLVGMSGSLEQLYLYQLRERVLAKARAEFALETIDPANRPLFRYGPNRRLIVAAGAVLGAVLGILIAVIAAALRSRRTINEDFAAQG